MDSLYEFGMFLNNRAHWTQNFIKKSMVLGLGAMEETITDINLFSIADKYPDNIITKKFSRREEGKKSGADWLWIIGEPGSWIPLLIQAKIINPHTRKCFHLDYKRGEQRERLLYYARQHGYVPLYCIYSYVPTDIRLSQLSGKIKHINADWACSFLTPKMVRILSQKGIRDQKEILEYCIPWMEPFCLTKASCELKGKAISNAFTSIKDSLYRTISSKENEGFCLPKRIQWEDLETLQTVRDRLPLDICKWFKSNTETRFDIPVSGVSIISTMPISRIEELK